MTTGCRPMRFVRRLWRDDSGQSSFFAALTLFLLVGAIGYSYNVSLVVSKRVRLQNAADAAALSAAAVEANALAAISWLNGCETYIHARMQEILLDIPYTATAAATAEWGRYVMDRYGHGDLKENPVELNHNTNQLGFFRGLWNQITDLFNNLGGLFSNDEMNDADKERLESLLNEYNDPNTTPERSKEIEKTLKNDYGLDMTTSGLSKEELEDLKNRSKKATEEFNAASDDFLAAHAAFKKSYGKKNFSSDCDQASAYRDQMLKIGDNIAKGLTENEGMTKYSGVWSYETMSKFMAMEIGDIDDKIKSLTNMLNTNNLEIEKLEKEIANKSTPEKERNKAQEKINSLNEQNQLIQSNISSLETCRDELKDLKKQSDALHGKVKILDQKGQALEKIMEETKDRLGGGSGGVEPDKEDAEKRRKEILENWNNPPRTEYNVDDDGFLNSKNDPPEPWQLLKMVPIPVLNPYGPTVNMGRMTPLGTALSEVGIGGDYEEEDDIERDEGLEDAIKEWADEKTLTQGLPPWEELKTAFAGPFGKYLWPEIMRLRYGLDSNPDSMEDFLDFFHETLVPQAKKWVGHRKQSGKNFSNEGIRPGEQWIRQLSQIASAIASALPKLVRNEVVYSVAVNASTTSTVAIFPDPSDMAKWGDVAFARTDVQAGEKFFRYDGWFSPPNNPDLGHIWMPPPPYVNMYTFANSMAPSVKSAATVNNPAVWKVDEQLYGNRFLNESRRQNLRMRTESVAKVGANVVYNRIKEKLTSVNSTASKIITGLFDIEGLIQGIGDRIAEAFPVLDSPFPSLSYVVLADENDKVGNEASKPRYFRMNHEKSFYWDEYNGRVGGWSELDGPGASVRVAVKCWNQNDRLWRQPKKDSENNNKLIFDMFDGLANMFTMVPVTLPVPFGSSHYSFQNGLENIFSKTQINYNLNPRCQTGYAPGSNIFGLGHPLFVPSHGDPGDAFGAADGHWHFMHYHAHSGSCQVGFPGIGLCYAMFNCAFMGIIDWFIKGVTAMGEEDGPFDRRVGWDSTMHYPYKHWDGTVADDSSTTFGGEAASAQKKHIFCPVSTSNNFSEKLKVWNLISKALGHGEERQPPFSIPLTTDIKTNIMQLVPPLSLYAIDDPCDQITIDLIFVKITICKHILDHLENFSGDGMNPQLHGHVTCGKQPFTNIMPKDVIPLFNTPVLWNWGDSDPSIISMWGAFLTKGDMEGDPFMSLGSGDRYFYPEIFYRLNGAVGDWLFNDDSRYATGRPRQFTKLNNPLKWGTELVGMGINALGKASGIMDNFGFGDGISGIMNTISSGLGSLLDKLGEWMGGGSLNINNKVTKDVSNLKSNAELFKSGSIFHETFTTIFDLISRWGHHRFMTCPLCMSYCPMNCDFHEKESGYPIRHWGGDYGGADTFDILPGGGADFGGVVGVYYKALKFMSIMPGLLSTGDQKSDAGMTYSNVIRGHDFSPSKSGKASERWYNRQSDATKKKYDYGNSYFDLGVDLDDGLAGNGPLSTLIADIDGTGVRVWNNKFPMDRFVREWMSPIKSASSSPDTTLAPTVMITENFMRHAITVAVIERYKPMLWMFGSSRPMMAVATAKCGFIERPDVYVGDERVVVDGLGVDPKATPQIITGIGEADGGDDANPKGWDLDSLWSNFLDFPNKRPIGESNLYYGNWGAKMIPTRYGILANPIYDTTNARRNTANQITSEREAYYDLWLQLGMSTCYRGDGATFTNRKTLAEQAGMTTSEWMNFANAVVDSSRAAANTLGR